MRRRLLLAALACPLARAAGVVEPLLPGRPLVFARDFGAHPRQRLEWWYLTGQVDPPPGVAGPVLGLQLTFFRQRTQVDPDNPSAFAAHQLLLAHAALADPRRGALLHAERIARAGLGIAQAATDDTDLTLDHWHLRRDPASGAYHGAARAVGFTIEFVAIPTQALLLQGDRGYSIKEPTHPGAVAASYYYSEPQLALQARIVVEGAATAEAQWRHGRAWLDHEWSSALLPAQAGGWDWGGFNLDDGSALTVFQVRARPRADGAAPALFAYAALRRPPGALRLYAPAQLSWTPLRQWQSPRTRARYPVAQAIRIGERQFETRPMMDDQELDARASSGLVYWEGASELWESGRPCGRGYLEMTGYAGAAPGAG